MIWLLRLVLLIAVGLCLACAIGQFENDHHNSAIVIGAFGMFLCLAIACSFIKEYKP